jgi:serine protease AprX
VINPLDMAVEAAWKSGITVVTSSGNSGPFNGTVLSPGDDPLVITVGALDDMGTTALGDDEMTDFSSAGPTSPDGWAKPDLVTSGRSVVSLAAPGSAVYSAYRGARIGGANFVGSGTSFSAAITSGAAALVLANHPTATPGQVKALLLGTTNPGPIGNPFVDGHGALNVYAAAHAASMDLKQSTVGLPIAAIGLTVSLVPTGSADTWNLGLWSGAAPVSLSWTYSGFTSRAWNGDSWSGTAWNGFAWDSRAWNEAHWAGAAWTGRAWNNVSWNGSAWN